MAILKCKMCGGELNLEDGMTVAECEYCGSKQTVPTADNEKKMMMFERANKLRYACEFDKAAGVYESIIADFPYEAEAYWGLVLCKYGIEYVDDPATGKKIPTCHRSSFDSIMDDSDFEQVMENADAIARRVYREEAKQIEELRKNIIEVSSKEEPYDIFICYKETDEDGNRTIDSVIAQDIYKELSNEGYRVFFARISLEDKLGTAYEPYIFAALNSAKVMLAFGTDYDYYNAVWVKNEWSRFLALIAKGEKKTLIPCYKDIDAYDIPREFKHLQAQDMGKVGAMQDLLRGIGKLISKKAAQNTSPQPQIINSGGPNTDSLLRRANLFLEERNWTSANEYYDKALDINPENTQAYIGKYCVQEKAVSLDEIADRFIQTSSCEMLIDSKIGLDSSSLPAVLTANGKKVTVDNKTLELLQSGDKVTAIKHVREITGMGLKEAKELYDNADPECIQSGRVSSYSAQVDIPAELQSKKEEILNQYTIAGYLNQRFISRLFTIDMSYIDYVGVAIHNRDAVAAKLAGERYLTLAKRFANSEEESRLDSFETKIGTAYDALIDSAKDKKSQKQRELLEACKQTYSDAGIRAKEKYDVAFAARKSHYEKACELENEGKYSDAKAFFEKTAPYEDSEKHIENCKRQIEIIRQNEENAKIAAEQERLAKEAAEKVLLEKQHKLLPLVQNRIVGYNLLIKSRLGLKIDGKLISTDKELSSLVSGWSDLIEIGSGSDYIVGLKSDGQVLVRTDGNSLTSWALRASKWTGVVTIAAGDCCLAGLRYDGRVLFCSLYDDTIDYTKWTDIKAIAAGYAHAVGLRRNGTVVTVGSDHENRCKVSGWRDIQAIAAGDWHTIGLKSDGTVIATAHPDKGKKMSIYKQRDSTYSGQCDVENWRDIIAIFADGKSSYGIKSSDSKVLSWCKDINSNMYLYTDGHLGKHEDVRLFDDLLKVPDQLLSMLNRRLDEVKTELANCKGFFAAKKREKLEKSIATLEWHIRRVTSIRDSL